MMEPTAMTATTPGTQKPFSLQEVLDAMKWLRDAPPALVRITVTQKRFNVLKESVPKGEEPATLAEYLTGTPIFIDDELEPRIIARLRFNDGVERDLLVGDNGNSMRLHLPFEFIKIVEDAREGKM